MELVVASCSVDDGIRSWDLRSGKEHLHCRTCASPSHGLLWVSGRFLASSQLCVNHSTSAPIFFWSWGKPQIQVKSFPAEPIRPLISDSDGSYIIGGGSSGAIYLWEVATGRLLKKWNAHYRSVTCLTLSDDESLLISGSEDGSVRVWPLLMIFDDATKESGRNIYRYSFSDHSLRVTSVISGHGLSNAVVISSSEDRTCKVWSLSEGRLLRSITFPYIIDTIAMDPGEHIFYAGCRDGNIYVTALNAACDSVSYGKFIIGSLGNHSMAITSLAFSTDGVTLVSGSEDGTVRVWNTKSGQLVRLLKHSKAPVSNILVVRQPINISQVSLSRKHEHLLMASPLDRYSSSGEDEVESKAVKLLHRSPDDFNNSCNAISVMIGQIKELQKSASAESAQMELERLRLECKRSMQLAQQWKQLYNDLQATFVNEILDEDSLDGS